MFERIKDITNKWFENQKDPQLRHEFPLYDINDNLYDQRNEKTPSLDHSNQRIEKS